MGMELLFTIMEIGLKDSTTMGFDVVKEYLTIIQAIRKKLEITNIAIKTPNIIQALILLL